MSKQTNKTNRNMKGGRKYDQRDSRRSKRRADEYDKAGTEAYSSGSNDFNWYNGIPGLMDQVSKISTHYAVGVPARLETTVTPDQVAVLNEKFISPAVMRVPFLTLYGRLEGELDPTTVAARQIASYIRSTSGRNASYDAPDMMMYLMAVSSLHNYLEWMKRTYGIFRMYYTDNRNVPTVLARAMRIDFDDFKKNLANFKAFITTFAYRVAQFPLPGDIPIFTRHKWLHSNIYADDPISKTQIIVFDPSYFHKWSYDDIGATKIEFKRFGERDNSNYYAQDLETMSFDYVVQFAEDLLSAIVVDGSVTTIASDIERSFKGNLAPVADIPEDYKMSFSYDTLVLNALRNATTYDRKAVLAKAGIIQNTDVNGGYLKYTSLSFGDAVAGPRPELNAQHLSTGLLTFEETSPDVKTIVESTRWHGANNGTWNGTTLNSVTDYTVNAEMLFTPIVYTYDVDEGPVPTLYAYPSSFLVINNLAMDSFIYYPALYDGLDTVAPMKYNFHAFTHAPVRYFNRIVTRAEDLTDFSNVEYVDGPYVEPTNLSNFVIPSFQWLRNINNACMLALWKVPSVGQDFQMR